MRVKTPAIVPAAYPPRPFVTSHSREIVSFKSQHTPRSNIMDMPLPSSEVWSPQDMGFESVRKCRGDSALNQTEVSLAPTTLSPYAASSVSHNTLRNTMFHSFFTKALQDM